LIWRGGNEAEGGLLVMVVVGYVGKVLKSKMLEREKECVPCVWFYVDISLNTNTRPFTTFYKIYSNARG